jgi:hypothetical protein
MTTFTTAYLVVSLTVILYLVRLGARQCRLLGDLRTGWGGSCIAAPADDDSGWQYNCHPNPAHQEDLRRCG